MSTRPNQALHRKGRIIGIVEADLETEVSDLKAYIKEKLEVANNKREANRVRHI